MPTLLQRLSSLLNMPSARPFKEMGVSGTPVYGGFLYSPEKSSDWRGQERYRISSEIAANVSIVAASIHYFLNLIARPSWTVKSADINSPAANELAEFMDDVIRNTFTPWPRIVRRAAMYRFHGFGIQEWTALRRVDGQIGLADIESRPQHTIDQWDIADDGKVNGVWQRSPQTGALLGLPRNKIIYLVEDTLTDSPEGLGIFRNLLEPYNRFKEYLDLEARSFERDLRGIPVGRAPINLMNEAVTEGRLTQEEANSLIKGMEDFVKLAAKQSDTGLVLDSQPYESIAADGPKIAGVPHWNIELLQGSSSGLSELAKAIDRLQREMSRIIGTESLMMGAEGGNRALSQDKSRNLYLIANSCLANIAAGYTHDVIGPIWLLNNFPDELRPTFEVEDVSFRNVSEIGTVLRDLASAGAVMAPDDPVLADVRQLLGVSPPGPLSPEMLGMLSGGAPDKGENDESDVGGA